MVWQLWTSSMSSLVPGYQSLSATLCRFVHRPFAALPIAKALSLTCSQQSFPSSYGEYLPWILSKCSFCFSVLRLGTGGKWVPITRYRSRMLSYSLDARSAARTFRSVCYRFYLSTFRNSFGRSVHRWSLCPIIIIIQ